MALPFSFQQIKRAITALLARLKQDKGQKTMPTALSLRAMMQRIALTREVEIGCDECFEQLDHFVELSIAGKNAEEALPLVGAHLQQCDDCREEFELLQAMLKAEISDE